MRAGRVAEAAGVNLQTLRYYERRGLLPVPERSLGGHRVYGADAVTRLRVIKAAQRLGFTLAEVQGLIEVGRLHHHAPEGNHDPRTHPLSGLQDAARAKLEEVEARIQDLGLIRDTLRAAVDAGCDDLLACACSDACPIPFEGIAGDRPGT